MVLRPVICWQQLWRSKRRLISLCGPWGRCSPFSSTPTSTWECSRGFRCFVAVQAKGTVLPISFKHLQHIYPGWTIDACTLPGGHYQHCNRHTGTFAQLQSPRLKWCEVIPCNCLLHFLIDLRILKMKLRCIKQKLQTQQKDRTKGGGDHSEKSRQKRNQSSAARILALNTRML